MTTLEWSAFPFAGLFCCLIPFGLEDITIRWGCCNKVPQTSGLNNRNYGLTVLEARCPRSGCQEEWFLLRTVRKNLCHASPPASVFCWRWCPVVCRTITPISALIFTCSSCVPVCVQVPLVIRTLVVLD